MKIVIAIDSFKGSVSSAEGSEHIASGIRDVYPDAEIIALPLADGGEGTVDALVSATGGSMRSVAATGPLGQPVTASYGVLGNGRTAVIEMASASGLPLVPPESRNPLLTTTYGVGELILNALHEGCRDFVIGLGGSATNDAGMGMLQALGCRFLDDGGAPVGFGGRELRRVGRIDVSGMPAELADCTFKVACDVDNPLYGPDGAAFVFAPQKGATKEMVAELDAGLRHFADTVMRQLGIEIGLIPGGGAAGGLGAAFAGLLKAELQSGVGLVLDMIGMDEHLQGAQFVITGEGRLDGQTGRGKAPLGVAKRAAKLGIPVIALAGSVGEGAGQLNEMGITSYFPIVSGPMPLEQAMDPAVAGRHLRTTARQLFRLIRAADGRG